ncbi:MAG TPA: hypothetical protein VE685_13465 [Thermoanaerobaculia bacterium]|nr:hypothetical protein [Thermoanaerobaculia bacterium]
MTICKCVALAYLVLLSALLSPAPAGAGEAEDRVSNLFRLELDDPRVEVKVSLLPENKLAVVLNGEVETKAERDRLVRLAHEIRPANVQIFDRLVVRSQERPLLDEEEELTDIWPLTYIRSRVTPTGTDLLPGTGSSGPDNIDLLVLALNQIYGSPGQPAIQRAGSNRLVLRGPRETLIALKRLLALADAPWPQVQMNMWAVQVSGSPAEISRRIEEISVEVRRTRDRMIEVQQKLADIVTEEGDAENTAYLRKELEVAGIDLNPDGPLSLNESLVLLILRPNRQSKIGELRRFAEGVRKELQEKNKEEDPVVPFRRLEQALSQGTYEAEIQGFFEFRDALACFKNRERWMYRPDAPRRLIRTGATVDRLLKSVMDAFAADMTDLFLDPLLRRIQGIAPLERDNGISLVGRTRIVVTSGLEAGLAPEMATFVETTQPKPFGKELLDAAFPTTESGTSSSGDEVTGAARVLSGLASSEALLLAAALAADVEPTYSKVAPGIAINVRPTVLPDGGAARLTIDARFGVNSTPLDPDGTTDTRRQPPADGIISHNVRTDAAVTAFDLFEISSFSVTASHPQAPLYVPILGRLPVIGRAFQFPRRNKETHFESLVLVNAVILPRSLELHRFYGRDASPEREPADCHEPR